MVWLDNKIINGSSRPDMFCKKGVLRNFPKFTGKHLCQILFSINFFIKKETLAQAFSCEFCEISKSTFFYRTLPVAASGKNSVMLLWCHECNEDIMHFLSGNIVLNISLKICRYNKRSDLMIIVCLMCSIDFNLALLVDKTLFFCNVPDFQIHVTMF